MSELQQQFKELLFLNHQLEESLGTASKLCKVTEDWEKLFGVVNKIDEIVLLAKLELQKKYPPARSHYGANQSPAPAAKHAEQPERPPQNFRQQQQHNPAPKAPDNKEHGELEPHKIFLPRLNPSTTENDLRSVFEHYGEIKEARVHRNPDGTSKCSAIVGFTSTDLPKRLIKSTCFINATEVTVQACYAKPPNKDNKQRPAPGGSAPPRPQKGKGK